MQGRTPGTHVQYPCGASALWTCLPYSISFVIVMYPWPTVRALVSHCQWVLFLTYSAALRSTYYYNNNNVIINVWNHEHAKFLLLVFATLQKPYRRHFACYHDWFNRFLRIVVISVEILRHPWVVLYECATGSFCWCWIIDIRSEKLYSKLYFPQLIMCSIVAMSLSVCRS